MLRNRRRNVRKRNTGNIRNRNVTRTTSSDDEFITSDSWDSSSSFSDLDDSEITDERSFPSSSTSRRTTGYKSSNRKSNSRNTSTQPVRRRNNLNNAGPSNTSTSSCSSSSRGQNGTSKRKYKERSKISDSDETSSEDFFSHIRVKRLRHSDLDSDDSDDSVIQPVTVRRNGIIQSDSSSSSSTSEIMRRNPRQRTGMLYSTWSSDELEGSSMNRSLENRNVMNIDGASTSSSSLSSASSFISSSDSVTSSVLSNSSTFGNLFNTDTSGVSNASSNQESTNSFISTKEQVSSSDSDDTDPDSEKCAICLNKFRLQQIGSPSNCDHSFCKKCLQEWSKSSTTCPVDRSLFDAILVRNTVGGDVVERIEVQNRSFVVFPLNDNEEIALNDTIICETCGSGEDEETLLLCDLCNLGYHMACLDPPLEAVPAGAWYCPPCHQLYRNSNQNAREAMRQLISNLPFSSIAFSPSSSRPSQNRSRNNRTRISGPPPRGRGPSVSRRPRDDATNVIQAVLDTHFEDLRTVQQRRTGRTRQRRTRNGRSQRNRTRDVAAQVTRYLTEIANSSVRIDRRLDEMLTLVDSRSMNRPSEIVDMVFPSFSLFGNNDLDYFSEDQNDGGLEGEVAIMARVRSEYSARRVENRKNIASSLLNSHHQAYVAPVVEVNTTQDIGSTTSLLDSILENQTLWHSKNVEISSKKDGKLEIRLKKDEEKRPDLSSTNHPSKEIPLYPNKNENTSSDTNKSYTNNSRYSNFGGSNSNNSSTSFSQSTSFFSSLNPSTRPGFSNLLGNNSSALDLSPFRGTTPIRFRMNPPRSGLRRAGYNANSARHTAANSTVTNSSTQSSRKPSSLQPTTSGEDDVDLYDDIETENAETERSTEMYASLEPPPEPPALLIGSDSSDEDDGLVIDDKAGSAGKSNIYDPTDPNEDSDVESGQNKSFNIAPDYMRSPSYGGISEFGPHLPLPEPPALPIELESVNNSDSDEEAEFPNMNLYSKTSITLANNVQDIPIPDAAYPSSIRNEFLDDIPIPNAETNEQMQKPSESSSKAKVTSSELYSPTKKIISDSDSDIEEVKVDEEKTSSRRSSDGRSSSESRDSWSDGESRKSRPKTKNSSTGGKRKKSPKISRDESSEDESYEEKEYVEVSTDDEKSSRQRSRDSSVVEEENSQTSTKKFSDDEEVSEVSPRRKTSSGDDAPHRKTHKPDVSEICDITSKDSTDVVIVDDKPESRASDTEAATEDREESVDIAEASSKAEDDTDVTEKKPEDDSEQPQIIDIDESQIEIEKSLEEKTDDEPKDDAASETTKTDSAAGACLLPSDDLDPVSDVESNDFADYQKLSAKERRKKRKKTRKRDLSADTSAKGERELEEGEIEDEKTKKKHEIPKKRRTSESEERLSGKKQKRRKDRKDKGTGKENKEAPKAENSFTWKKLSKSTKGRNYRDGKSKSDKLAERNKERESTKKKEKRKEMERYDVRKIVSEKPRTVRDEFGRDISPPRSCTRSVSVARSYNSRRRSKERGARRSLSQDDRWIDWSPVWTQRRSRSRTRRSRSRSRNRSRLSSDRYHNVSKSRPREHDKRESRKRRRSLSSVERYSSGDKKRRRSRERSRRSGSYGNARLSRDVSEQHFFERSWSRSPTLYASLTPEPEPYLSRYERSPSIIEQTRISVVSPEPGMLTPNPQNLTVIVPNVDMTKKKHKKKKDGKKKKKKQQPSKEVFTSGDNIVVSVNFDDNQKIISAKSSKRKHDDEKTRKKKKDESSRKKRKQTLQVSEEVLNAKPVAVIDLNTSPCKEMSPMEVISLTDSGDENATNENAAGDRRAQTNETANKSPERRPYVMTSAGPKTPPEPPIKFTVGSAAPMRTLPTNPIFVQDELERVDGAVHYNKGPNTPPEPSNATPNTTMYDPFEPTKSRSPSPANAEMYKERQEKTPEGRQTIDIFADDAEKQSDSQANEKSKPTEESKDGATPAVSSEESQPTKPSPAKETAPTEGSNEATQANGVNTLVLDLSSLGDDFVPKSSIPLVKTSQGKYEFQSSKTPDKPITVVIAQQSTSVKPQPQQVMVTPTRQIPTKPVEPIKQPMFPDILPWKLPPLSQASFTTPPPVVSTVTPTTLVTPSKSSSATLAQNGNQDESSFDLDDSPYSPASSEGDDLFEPPPLNASSSPKSRPPAMPPVNSYKARVDALFNSSPVKKYPRPGPHSKPVSAIKGAKKMPKPMMGMGGKKEVGIKADEEQLKILDDVPNSAVEMIVKEKFLKKLHRQERVVEEVKVVLKPHYARKHITKEEYKDILRRAVPKICHNKTGDINPSKIQSLVEAYVKKIRYSKKKGSMNTLPGSTAAPMFPSMAGMANAGKPMKKQKTLWG